MPIYVIGNSSNFSENRIVTSIFVQKPYLRTKYIESNIEEDVDLKNQFGTKNLPGPKIIRQTCSENYADNLFNDPSIIRNSAHVNFNDKKLDNVRFVKVNSLPVVREHPTPKFYNDDTISQSVDETSLIWLNLDEELKRD